MIRKLRAWQSRGLWNELTEKLERNAVLTGFDAHVRSNGFSAFMETGVSDVARDLKRILEFRPTLARQRALDFGCGMGRLTRALATNFTEVVGADISDEMIRRANGLHRECNSIRFIRIEAGLSPFPADSFDLVYSLITLQHMPQSLAAFALRDMLRVCRPGGVVLAQAVSKLPPRIFTSFWPPTLASRLVKKFFQTLAGSVPFYPEVQMYALRRSAVERLIRDHGGTLLAADPDFSAGANHESYRYLILKR